MLLYQDNDMAMRIDPHVHCRDGKQAYKETIEHVLWLAEQQGVKKIIDVPNTDAPVLREQDVEDRLRLVSLKKKKMYSLYVILTGDENQIKSAVRCHEKYREVAGLKLFAGHSTGNLGVVSLEDQPKAFKTLEELGYKGVLAVHCEKDSLIKKDEKGNQDWNPCMPITHAYARPKEAEIESVRDQINLAMATNFKGVLHICHISCPEAVELVYSARKEIRITCGVTPHHIMFSDEKLKDLSCGLQYKTNPPLRSAEDVEKLRQQLKDGKIDWIETDHAPHAYGEKVRPPFESGYPSLYWYKEFVTDFLPGIGVEKSLIEKMTYANIVNTFGERLK